MDLSRRKFFSSSAAVGVAALAGTFIPETLSALQEPARAASPGGPILLNSNENAYGPWPELMEKMRASLARMNRYPDGETAVLRNRIAALHRVGPEQVLLGCGSTELLKVCADAFLQPGSALVQPSPTFEVVAYYARANGAAVKSVPLDAHFSHDLPNMLTAADGRPPGLVYICNPNNPTASITPRKAIEEFLSKLAPETHVLIDEAYHHFAGGEAEYVSFLDKPVDDERVIVTRTFSKIFGLAGMRLGYAIAKRETTDQLKKFMLEDNLNMMSVMTGPEALEDMDALARAIRRNDNDRAQFMAEAKKRNVKAIPSFANFVMIDTGRPVKETIDYYRSNAVLIGRPFPPLDTYARISLGTPGEMKTFWQLWDARK